MNPSGWLVCVFVAASAGCLPHPHQYQHRPRVEGHVTEAEVDREGVRVSLRWLGGDQRSPCDQPAEIAAITDATGHFVLEGERRLRLWIFVVPAHSVEIWGFCFETPGGRQTAWATPSRHRAGPRYGPRSFELDCDLARRGTEICSMRGGGEYGKFG